MDERTMAEQNWHTAAPRRQPVEGERVEVERDPSDPRSRDESRVHTSRGDWEGAGEWRDGPRSGYGRGGFGQPSEFGNRGYGETGFGEARGGGWGSEPGYRGMHGQDYGFATEPGSARRRPVRGGESWSRPGPYTGRGPADYRRSDEAIRDEACERLTRHGQVDASSITLRVERGEVILEGTVESRHVKRMAEDAVDTVFGVRDVHNRLRIAERP